MIRLVILATAILGLAVAVAGSECSPKDGKPGIDGAVWQAAGLLPLTNAGQASPLRLADLSGKAVDLRQLHGRLVMVYFWATW